MYLQGLTLLAAIHVHGAQPPPHDICQHQPMRGNCKSFVGRYYFDVNLGNCAMFIYGGCGGNPNNFEHIGECMSVCGNRGQNGGQGGSYASEYPNSPQEDTHWHSHNAGDKDHWHSHGGDEQGSQGDDPYYLNLDWSGGNNGQGGNQQDNWGYGGPQQDNWGSEGPQQDNWGSGGPQQDNWGSGGPQQDNWGSGGYQQDNWGSGGPEEEAYKSYGTDLIRNPGRVVKTEYDPSDVVQTESYYQEWDHMADNKKSQQPPKDCMSPPDPGTCLAEEKKYYFDTMAGECLEFVYRGCQGNGNRFDTHADCMKTCSSGIDNKRRIRIFMT